MPRSPWLPGRGASSTSSGGPSSRLTPDSLELLAHHLAGASRPAAGVQVAPMAMALGSGREAAAPPEKTELSSPAQSRPISSGDVAAAGDRCGCSRRAAGVWRASGEPCGAVGRLAGVLGCGCPGAVSAGRREPVTVLGERSCRRAIVRRDRAEAGSASACRRVGQARDLIGVSHAGSSLASAPGSVDAAPARCGSCRCPACRTTPPTR